MSACLSPISRRRGNSWDNIRASRNSLVKLLRGPPSKKRCRPVDSNRTRASRPRVDAAEVARFEDLGEDWWDFSGPMRALHALNPVRVSYIRDAIAKHGAFEGARILDIGCGGGILCEPLARMGADMTGVDPAPGNIGIARVHAAPQGLAIDYRADTAEAL